MAQRPIDRLAKRLLELRLPTDVVPAHAWHLERQFAQSARFYQLQRALYVGPPDGLARQARCVFAGRRRVDRARECGERGVTVQRGEVGADKTRGARSEFVEPRAGEGVRCVCEQRDGNRTPLILRRHTHLHLSVEATGPAQGRVERVGSVRRANDNDSFSAWRAGAVHFAKESGKQSRFCAAICRAACAKRVHFIEEDYRGRAPSCVGECSDEPAFGIHARR